MWISETVSSSFLANCTGGLGSYSSGVFKLQVADLSEVVGVVVVVWDRGLDFFCLKVVAVRAQSALDVILNDRRTSEAHFLTRLAFFGKLIYLLHSFGNEFSGCWVDGVYVNLPSRGVRAHIPDTILVFFLVGDHADLLGVTLEAANLKVGDFVGHNAPEEWLAVVHEVDVRLGRQNHEEGVVVVLLSDSVAVTLDREVVLVESCDDSDEIHELLLEHWTVRELADYLQVAWGFDQGHYVFWLPEILVGLTQIVGQATHDSVVPPQRVSDPSSVLHDFLCLLGGLTDDINKLDSLGQRVEKDLKLVALLKRERRRKWLTISYFSKILSSSIFLISLCT